MRPEIIIPLLFFTFFAAVWLISTYNRFIKYQNRIEEAWSSIDVALKRRFNLIQSLVSVIKGYSEHEADIFDNKTKYLKKEDGVAGRMESESEITQLLSHLLARAEAYPELKASVNFLELQRSLVDIEKDIQASRIRYNNTVARLNILVESFPASLIAAKFGFTQKDYFSLDLATQRELPEIHLAKKAV
ncbi:MAG: LemA family protein [Desulforhopalus sp.]